MILLEVSSNMKIKENKNRALIHSVVSVGINRLVIEQKNFCTKILCPCMLPCFAMLWLERSGTKRLKGPLFKTRRFSL